MTDQELHAAANTLVAEISNEITALARRRAAPLTESQQAVATRATALAADRERRDRAGVRVHASADGLSERMLAHAADVFALTAGAMTRNSADVENLASMLRRSFLMITQLSDALIAPERVAAAAESAAWEVSEARRNAPVEPEAFALYRADRLARGLAL